MGALLEEDAAHAIRLLAFDLCNDNEDSFRRLKKRASVFAWSGDGTLGGLH